MIDPEDMAHCREAIRTGSYSFHAASRLLPGAIRDPALALYAFCRLADDAVDENDEKAAAVLRLRERLDKVYAGTPRNAPADRAFAAVVEEFAMPRDLPDALLEGLAWDAQERRYQTFGDLCAYSARVASAVGVMMCVLMRARDPDTLARAADLGVAMQLTNIARDVGEDAREGRLYLPLDWFADEEVAPDAFLADPRPSKPIRRMTARLLRESQKLYWRSEAGISALPRAARPGIYAARHVYAGIGGVIARAGHDSVTRRAATGKRAKLGWLMLALGRSAVSMVAPQSALLHARALPETQFLVTAAALESGAGGRSGALISVLAHLKAQDRAARAAG